MEVVVELTELAVRHDGLDGAISEVASGNVVIDFVVDPGLYKVEVVNVGRLGFRIELVPLPEVIPQDG